MRVEIDSLLYLVLKKKLLDLIKKNLWSGPRKTQGLHTKKLRVSGKKLRSASTKLRFLAKTPIST